jgi:hypothetical protein
MSQWTVFACRFPPEENTHGKNQRFSLTDDSISWLSPKRSSKVKVRQKLECECGFWSFPSLLAGIAFDGTVSANNEIRPVLILDLKGLTARSRRVAPGASNKARFLNEKFSSLLRAFWQENFFGHESTSNKKV